VDTVTAKSMLHVDMPHQIPFSICKKKEREKSAEMVGVQVQPVSSIGIIFRVFLDLRRTIVQFQADLRALNIAWIIREFNRKFAGSQQSYCIRKSVL